MPTALITGSKGFIGSHLVKALSDKGWGITEFDLPDDVCDKNIWKRKLPAIDYIFHLAGHLDDYGTKTEFSKYIDINIRSIATMFEVIVEKKFLIKKILVASSQSVYGEGLYDFNGLPIQETEVHPLKPISLYGASKAAMEDILLTLGKLYNIPVVAMRFSIVLGPRQKFKDMDSRILPSFIEMAKNGKIITHEDGEQSRDFINIHDLIDAQITLARSKVEGIFNIGSGIKTTIKEVANYIAEIYEARIEHSGIKRINTARHQIMNIEKITKQTKWRPKLTWKDAVNEYI